MRQVFTSQRLETVEGVARLLEDAGIAVYISQPRSYHSRRSGQFSYSAAIGLFNNIVNIIFILIVNTASKRATEVSLW